MSAINASGTVNVTQTANVKRREIRLARGERARMLAICGTNMSEALKSMKVLDANAKVANSRTAFG